MRKFIERLHILPSWVVLSIDLVICFLATFLALILRDSFNFLAKLSGDYYLIAPFAIIGIRLLIMLLFSEHKKVVRYTSTRDLLRIIFLTLLGSVIFMLGNFIFQIFYASRIIPISVIGMEFFITTIGLLSYRIMFKVYYLDTVSSSKTKKNIVIFGAGEAGVITKQALERDAKINYNVLAFFDDDPNKVGMNVAGLPVKSVEQMPAYLKEKAISFIIISIQNLSAKKKNEITEIALANDVKALLVPPISNWINGELSFKQIKKVKIEDVLEREEIKIDRSLIVDEIMDKTIMITGAAGSIGSEIVRQLLHFSYKKLILVDNAETPMFYITQELFTKLKAQRVDCVIADVNDVDKMTSIFETYRPELVYHAAAYKHVFLMEENPQAAIKVNVLGTKKLADIAVQYGVNKFVMISTDKAVNPTSVMGASKRIAEMYVQSMNYHQDRTKFITTRFGNVLGSNGSVIPIFRKQIESGGPVTVTHPEVTRFFMTIPEACQLVLTAGVMGHGGEIFIFDMGKPVKIYDLAKKMIQLSGLTLGKDITIEFSGLKTGEKLYEELLANQENTIETSHDKIMIAQVRMNDYATVSAQVENIVNSKYLSKRELMVLVKEMIPEFISE